MSYLLPTSLYQSLPRLGRGRPLNTIVEDSEGSHCGMRSDDEEESPRNSTIIERLGGIPAKCFAQPPKRSIPVSTRRPASVVSSEGADDELDHYSSRGSYAASETGTVSSEAGTVFSDACPSLTGSHVSDATSFMTDSSCNSVASRGGKNRFPALFIPRGSWQDLDGANKHLSIGMTPSAKIILSPEALERLPINVTNPDCPPSLGDASSTRSNSPCLPSCTNAPPTPDMRDLDSGAGHLWQHDGQLTLDTPLEIALDDEHSILLSAAEAHSTRPASSNYIEIMHSFPLIPGLTPIDTPITPSIPRAIALDKLTGETGVQLPAQALAMLNSLDREQYAESFTDSSASEEEEEMQECAVPSSRPHTWCNESPYTEYSVSQLSIPSPGGFFSSLKMGIRSTWCSPTRKQSSSPPPSSTTAENFYKAPWASSSPRIKETILEYEDDNDTEGPPTVKKATFDASLHTPKDEEDEDMYGSKKQWTTRHEYEDSYEQNLKQAGEVNLSRTSDWLAAQTDYLSVLRGSNPVNDLVSKRSSSGTCGNPSPKNRTQVSKSTASPSRETMFLQAFTHQKSESKRTDVFLHASSRLDSVQSTRVAAPKRHVQTLLNTHTSKTLEPAHARPKYRGPFAQNPRNTLELTNEKEQAEFQTLERQQTALTAIKPNIWSLEAQRTILYNGRLMANRVASERLTQIDTEFRESQTLEQSERPQKRRPRILDLGGAATASWAWAAATKWPNSRVITVQTKIQADLARNYAANDDDDCDRPETPTNHKVFSVPHLWSLPFRDNYFDVISARTLHMHLRAHPVPGVDSIDEWDLTLKECMRVLKPGGILDFFVMDSGISNGDSSDTADINLSPTVTTARDPKRIDIVNEFKSELQRRGYEADGGCGRLMARLKQEGFVGVRRQWIGLPMGRAENESAAAKMHKRTTSNQSATSHWINQSSTDWISGRATYRPAPRPISEVSDIARIVDQYADVEAVQGPVGSTNDVADMSALLGELLWEEWLVRLRIESGRYTPDTILDGVDEQFAEWRRSGKAAWRGVLGWARKPSRKEIQAIEEAHATNHIAPLYGMTSIQERELVFKSSSLPSPLPSPQPSVPFLTMALSAPAGIQRSASIRRSGRRAHTAGAGLTVCTNFESTDFRVRGGLSHVKKTRPQELKMRQAHRGESGEIPMMIVG